MTNDQGLMTLLADGAENFTTNVILSCPSIRHHAFARAHDDDAHPVQHGRKLLDAAVDAAAGLARAVDLVDDLVSVHPVLELDPDLALLLVFDDHIFFDVSFILEHLRDAG